MAESSTETLYYRHSGRFSLPGLFMALIAGLAVGIPVAWGYGQLDHWGGSKLLTFIGAGAFGILIGIVMGRALKSGKCRNTTVAAIMTFLVTAASYYAAWAVWLGADTGRSPMEFLQPARMAAAVLDASHKVYFLFGPMTGAPMWALWGLEAGFVLFLALVFSIDRSKSETFCENCEIWTTVSKNAALVNAGTVSDVQQTAAQLKQRLELKDFGYLRQLGVVPGGALAWFRLDLHSCPQCGMTHTLQLWKMCRNVNRETSSGRLVFRQLLLTAGEAGAIRELGEKLPPELPLLKARGEKRPRKWSKLQIGAVTFLAIWIVGCGIGIWWWQARKEPPPVIDNDQVTVMEYYPIPVNQHLGAIGLRESDRFRIMVCAPAGYTEAVPAGTRAESAASTHVAVITPKGTGDPAKTVTGPLDPLTLDPKHYSLAFDFGAARGLLLLIGPGESTPLHEHKLNRVVMYLNDQDIRVTDDAGNVTTVHHKSGEVAWLGPARDSEMNVGKGRSDTVMVELKTGLQAAPNASLAPVAPESKPPDPTPLVSRPPDANAPDPSPQHTKKGRRRRRGHN